MILRWDGMTEDEVQKIVRSQADGHLGARNDHKITLGQMLLQPRRITIIDREIRDGRVTDKEEIVWLIGRESPSGGYMIVMRDDGRKFGLASTGFPADEHPILSGWYGGLISTFLAM